MSKIDVKNKVNGKKSSVLHKFSTMQKFIIAIIAVVLIGGVVIFVVGSNNAEKVNLVVTPDNIAEILADMEASEKSVIGSYEVDMNTTWTFNNSDSPSRDAIVGNSPANLNTVYFKVTLKDTEEQVYKSPNIPVGSNLENIVLDKKLSAGTYPAVITYYLVDENLKDISHVSVNMTLVIQN